MLRPPHRCLGENCDKVITWSFAICADCENIYGKSAARDWPDWLRELWKLTQRERRAHKKIVRHEVDFSDIEESALESAQHD